VRTVTPMPAHHAPHDPHHLDFDADEMIEHAELEGVVLAGVVDEAAGVLTHLATARGLEVRRVLDLGSGPGLGTCALARAFDPAEVVAVDGAEGMLQRVVDRAAAEGLGHRVQVRRAELPAGLPGLGQADLVWASMSIHHLGDEAAALGSLRSLLTAGRLLAVVERGRPWRVLPDAVDLGRPRLWERADAATAAWFAGMRAALSGAAPSLDYPEMLAAAGYEVLVDQELPVDLPAPLDDRARPLARKQVAQARSHLGSASEADPADLAALDRLLDDADPRGILRRPDARLLGSRHLYVAAVA
jgi:SAM-dependent methyltransferase